ncbi:hypothetical protein DFH94DRAFT_737125 [Russula ochroleuca]|uniref:Uncharacterized protein n=1 Tax=Russula ochroleuca TaxID=152965 RepID=A0A9P5MX78_9AGAM|nr:hypothetical protein DFH94DRAFT_737125 [Russula ochroleuca]
MMQLSSSSDFTTTPHPTHRSLRHFPRDASSKHVSNTTIIIIVVSASVGGLILGIVFWRILSRLLAPKSAPLPPRQGLVHERELQLAAFTEHKDSLPDDPSTPEGSDSALLPSAREWPTYSTNRASSYTHETDEGAEAGRASSQGNHLHPPLPHFFAPSNSQSTSSSSLPSSNDNSSPSSDAPAAPFPTTSSPSQSFRRTADRRRSRPTSMVSLGTTYASIRSRQSIIRAAPHAPHSNVQIVIPAPLAPNLYGQTVGVGPRPQRSFVRGNAYSDSWRTSLADTWISVGQHEPEPSHDSMEGRSRLMRRGSSPGPLPPRSRSNPSPLSRPHPSSRPMPDDLPRGTHPPVPRVPSGYGVLPRQHSQPPSAPSRQGASLSPSP